MALPTFEDLMLPALQVLAASEQVRVRDLALIIADRLSLSTEEREQMLPSGSQLTIVNRTGWSCWHLMHAGLVYRPKRAHFAINDTGRKFLAEHPTEVNVKTLMTIPSYAAKLLKWREDAAKESAVREDDLPVQPSSTPHEQMASAFAELQRSLVGDLLEQLGKVDPFRFEQMVLDLLVAMGYGGSRKEAAEVTRKTGDEGIDGVINEDRLGLDVIYVQAKRWKSNVGRPEIQSFVGALAGKKANKGIFITTSDFHNNAREYAAGLHQKVILIDGQRLASLMIDHNIGVAEEHIYRLKRIDTDYFLDDAI